MPKINPVERFLVLEANKRTPYNRLVSIGGEMHPIIENADYNRLTYVINVVRDFILRRNPEGRGFFAETMFRELLTLYTDQHTSILSTPQSIDNSYSGDPGGDLMIGQFDKKIFQPYGLIDFKLTKHDEPRQKLKLGINIRTGGTPVLEYNLPTIGGFAELLNRFRENIIVGDIDLIHNQFHASAVNGFAAQALELLSGQDPVDLIDLFGKQITNFIGRSNIMVSVDELLDNYSMRKENLLEFLNQIYTATS